MAQDRFYMAVEKHRFNSTRSLNNFIDLDELGTHNCSNFDKFHTLNDHQTKDRISSYPKDCGNGYYNHYDNNNNNYNYGNSSYNKFSTSFTSLLNNNDNNHKKSNDTISMTTSSSLSINNSTSTSASSITVTSKNDIFDTPITLVCPAPRISAKEIEELQKQEKHREEEDQREKEKAREEINMKMKKELIDKSTKLYLDWDTLDPKDFNRLYKGNNNLKTMTTSTTTTTKITPNHNIDNIDTPNPTTTTDVLTTTNISTNTPTTTKTTATTTTTTTITTTTNSNNNNSNNSNSIKNKLNNMKLELNKLPVKDNSSRGSSPTKSSKILSPEEQIARFLNTPFQTSPNPNQNKSQVSPTNSIHSLKSTGNSLKTKSSFYGLSQSFSYSYEMDQESMSRLQKVWNKMYKKFVEMIPNINLSYLPTHKNLIGTGQYSNVYLGSYSVNNDDLENGKHDFSPDSEKSQDEDYDDDHHDYDYDYGTGNPNHSSTTTHYNYFNNNNFNQHYDYDVSEDDSPLKPCAVKCFHKDYVSQMVAMTELNILTMLTNQPYIIQLIGIINEIEENKLILHEEKEKEKEKKKEKKKNSNDSNLKNNGLVTAIFNDLDLNSDSNSDSISEPIQVTTILEYASNGNILSWIKKNTEYVGKKLWIKWARQITHAVATFHNMLIIHHDIKPQNILLDDYLNAKIADFGSSCYAPDEFPDRDDLTIENCRFPMDMGLGRGTQAYCAPELFGSGDSYTFATDIYSLGVTLITMMTGDEPFKNARSSIHMIMCIRKGFFNSGAHDTELRFLNGEMAEPKIVDLLIRCVDLDPMKRPTALKILETLMEIDDYVPLEEKL